MSKSKKNRHILLVWFIKQNDDKNILHTIPSDKFIIYVYTKYCKIVKQFGNDIFLNLISYRMCQKVKR